MAEQEEPEIIVGTPVDNAIYERLGAQGFPRGLVDALIRNRTLFPRRIWIIDNSGSMRRRDGQKLVQRGSGDDLFFRECTRWEELTETVSYHVGLAGILNAHTTFRLLNDQNGRTGSDEFSVAREEGVDIDADLYKAKSMMRDAAPNGYTPLVHHVKKIIKDIEIIAPSLRQSGQKIAVIIATDGSPSDGSKSEFVTYLKGLHHLPVWIVFRLCTNEDSVVDYFGDLDKLLEQPVEVLDDYVAEAEEIHKKNRWINYILPLHRSREVGFKHPLFDLIDERLLTKDEVFEYCELLFGEEAMKNCPAAASDWGKFKDFIGSLNKSTNMCWNPIMKKPTPLIDVDLLSIQYDEALDGCCNVC